MLINIENNHNDKYLQKLNVILNPRPVLGSLHVLSLIHQFFEVCLLPFYTLTSNSLIDFSHGYIVEIKQKAIYNTLESHSLCGVLNELLQNKAELGKLQQYFDYRTFSKTSLPPLAPQGLLLQTSTSGLFLINHNIDVEEEKCSYICIKW